MSTRNLELNDAAEFALSVAKRRGAQQAGAMVSREREVSVEWRDGKLEKLTEATTRRLTLRLFVDGRYSSVTTSDLRRTALDSFIHNAIVTTRLLAEDPHRRLPGEMYYPGAEGVDLKLVDPSYGGLAPEERLARARALDAAARSVPGNEAILSVTSGFNDSISESVLMHSDGFRGESSGTSFWNGVIVSVKDGDGKRPQDWNWVGTRHFNAMPDLEETGRHGAMRALARRGASKGASGFFTMVLENRAGRRFVESIKAPMSGDKLYQGQSCLEGKIGQRVGSDLLTVTDDPLVVGGFNSRLFDGEGMAARRLPLFVEGVLRNYYLNTYYASKLQAPPTTGDSANLEWKLGTKSQAELLREVGEGILVTSFLGGNSNSTTGDFSFGIGGFRIRGGEIAEPVSEMNISGNLLEIWQRLVAVGNDPYPYSGERTPTLVFEGVEFAGA